MDEALKEALEQALKGSEAQIDAKSDQILAAIEDCALVGPVSNISSGPFFLRDRNSYD
jgi:hypothetical protein